MHKFKRFYLLGAVTISLLIPLIVFTTVIYQSLDSTTTNNLDLVLLEFEEPQTIWLDYLPKILWSIYGLGLVIFGVKFFSNLRAIQLKIKNNPKHIHLDFINVLLIGLKVPHTFLNYIFLNRNKFENNEIPEAVFLHEQAHAKQKHTLDILFVEVLQVLFWFNPLLIWLKRNIRQNHEYLADQDVLSRGITPSLYQEILLTFSSSKQDMELVNAINYSSLKKRITLMKTQTSKQKTWLRSLLVLPLLAVLVYGFSSTKALYKTVETPSNTEPIELRISSEGKLIYGAKTIIIEDLSALVELTDYLEIAIDADKNVPPQIVLQTQENLIKYLKKQGLKHFSICSSQKDFNILESPLPEVSGRYKEQDEESKTENKARYARSVELKILDDKSYVIDGIEATKNTFLNVFNQLHQDISVETRKKILNIHVSSTHDISNKEVWFIYNSLQDYGFYRIVTPNQEINRVKGNTPFHIENEVDDKKEQQEGATKAEVKEYNALAKKYDAMLKTKSVNILLADVKRMKYIYGKMTDAQRQSAELFPNFPAPPKPPKAPMEIKEVKTPQSKRNEKVALRSLEEVTEQRKASKKPRVAKSPKPVSIEVVEVPPPPPPPIPQDATEEQKRRYKRTIAEYNKKYDPRINSKVGEILEVPPPPPPPMTIEELAEKGAIFYYENKKIKAKEAISLVNKNKNLNIQVKKHDSKQPMVKISKLPIVVEQKN